MKIGLYVHIPFCKSKCHYCDFLSFSMENSQQQYVEALVAELNGLSKRIKGVHTIGSIFIGGGTPSVLPPFLLQKVCETIKGSFDLEKDYEWTIECNPGTVTSEHVRVFNECGINRVSLGLQTTNDKLLKTIGRIHKFSDWEESMKLLIEHGITNINTDMMFALPRQTLEDWKNDLKKVTSYPITHISAYALILEEGTVLNTWYEENKLSFPSEEEDRKMYHYTKQFLEDRGYKQYEISNWSKEGRMCKQNLVYWHCEEYIGAGLGAHSYFEGVRYHNPYEIKTYIERSNDLEKLREDVELITDKMSMEEFMFLGLRLTNGISINEFERRYGQRLFEVYGKQINEWIKQKAIVKNKDRLYLSEVGIDISNQIFASFL